MTSIAGFELADGPPPGEGGMAQLRRARRTRSLPGFPAMQRVVLKMVPVDQEEQLESLEREAEALLEIQRTAPSPDAWSVGGAAIARIQPVDCSPMGQLVYSGIGRMEGSLHGPQVERAFIALEDVPGISLWSYVEGTPGRALSHEHASLIALRLANAMEWLNTSPRILHNDLKPQNIIIGPGASPFRVTLVDFGVSLRLNEFGEVEPGQHRMAYWGVEEYMSPEKLLARRGTPPSKLDWRSDLWSLATVTQFMIGCVSAQPSGSGRKPPLLETVSEPLRSFLTEALSADPCDRHWNWLQVKQDLEACVTAYRRTIPKPASPGKFPALLRTAANLINLARVRS
jgi:serine/threonine protein kinase